jgi:ATP-binding cassette, subfamily B, bacterial
MSSASANQRPPSRSPSSLRGLLPFLRPYKVQIALAVLFLVLAAAATLLFPVALRHLIDSGLVGQSQANRPWACADTSSPCSAWRWRWACSRRRFYLVSWLGERVTGRPAQRGLQPCAAPEPRVL